MNTVWIIDDDRSIRWVLEKALGREGIEHASFSSAGDALAELERTPQPPAVLLSDIRMPGESGLDLLQKVKAGHPHLPVIIMTAYSDLDSAVSAFQGGAFEYLPKPFDVDQAVALVRRALEQTAHQNGASEEATLAPEILGQAPAMQEVFRAIGRLAHSHATVLINGESGSGKELVARALHRHSPRRDAPFIAINTAAIPRDLLESELFGHERGAFTGAATQRRGRFEQADGGTLFLDEIGDMSASTQAKILRVLQEHEFERLGGTRTLKVDVRLIAATNRDLPTMVSNGQFREDLYYRLNVVTVETPPLRDRKEDILPLAMHFIRRFSQELKKKLDGVHPDAQKMLTRYNWPGNIRELENTVERAALLSEDRLIGADDLRIGGTSATPEQEGVHASVKIPPQGIPLEEIERQAVVEALKMANWVQKDAAELLSISPRVMNYKIKTLGIDYARGRRPMVESMAS